MFFLAFYKSYKGAVTQLGRFTAKDEKEAIGVAWRRAYSIVGQIDYLNEGGHLSATGRVDVKPAAPPASGELRH